MVLGREKLFNQRGKLHPRAVFVKDKLFEIIHLGSIFDIGVSFTVQTMYLIAFCLSVVLSSQ